MLSFRDRFWSVSFVALFLTAGVWAQARVAPHTNHLGTQIEEIMVGANGDSSVQFIEVAFAGCGQGLWGPSPFAPIASRAQLVFFDAAGNETFRFKFPNDVPCDATESHALIATAAFQGLPGAPAPDFIIPPKLNPISGKVCFRGNQEEAGFNSFQRNECVSYGAFTGSTETNDFNFPPFGPPAASLPIVGTVSLVRTSPTESNASFAVTNTPTPENRLGQTFSMPVVSQAQQGERLFNKETFGGNGRTCASCHVSSLGLGLTPANIQSRFSTLSSTFDLLFIGETKINLNTLVVSSPTSTGNRGVRDFEGIINGGGGTAKVLTKKIIPGDPTIRYLVYGGLSPQLSGTIVDANGNSAAFVSITPGSLACSAGGSATAACTNQLEHPGRMRQSVDITNFPQGRGLILENIDGFTNPHTSNHVFRKSPNLDNAKRTSPFGLSGLIGGAANLGDFATGAVKQHFPRTINRVGGTDFRLPTADERAAMDAFQQTRNVPADENFNLDRFASTAAQIAGRAAFFGPTAKCSKCHAGPVLADTDGSIAGKSGNANFNTGVDFMPINTGGDMLPLEAGGAREFNTPALFNVRNHAPFFHNGSASTVREAVEFYSSGPFQGSPANTQIGGLTFTDVAEIDNIIAFLDGLAVRPYTLTGGPLAFGTQNISSGPTAAKTVTITNNSGSAITLTSPFVRLTGTNPGQFVIASHNVPATLGNGSSATVNVTFDPTTSGAKSAILEFLAVIPSGVALTGTGGGASPPTITNINPNSGPTGGGQSVTITGTNLTGATVTIGGNNATVNSTNATTVVFTTPAHAAGAVNVVVNTSGGSATSTNGYTYTSATSTVILSRTSGLVTSETGETALYTMALNRQPTANVTIPISSGNPGEAVVSPASVVFTSANWNVARTITVTGVNDFVPDGNVAYTIINGTASSADSGFNGVNPSDVTGTNTGNGDLAGIVVTPVSGLFTTQLGAKATFTVVLTLQPTASVTISLNSSDTTEGRVSPGSLTFTTANWMNPRTVTVTGFHDGFAGMPVNYTIFTAAAISADPKYNGRNPPDVTITNYKDVRAQVITDLRAAINAKRALAGLAPFTFTDASLGGKNLKAVHITQLRTALDAARAALGQSTGGYTDPTLNSTVRVKAVHVQELKNRL